jgi:hypothetical protein
LTSPFHLQSTPPPPPPLVDRLSLLPNELLHSIFDSAYSSIPPSTPLSKHLYPFFEQHFYRKVRLSSSHRVDLFLETISAHPERGKLVKSLDFDRKKGRVVRSIDILESLLPLLPNLLHLEIKAESIDIGTRSKNLFGSLTTVKSVSTEPGADDEFVNLKYFAFLASLPSLSDLTVYEWPYQSAFEEEEVSYRLDVNALRIEGVGADDNSIDLLVSWCPALISVELSTTYDGHDISYGEALEVLPSTIHSLKLESKYASILPSDHALRRFSDLRFLDLDEGCYSETIHTVLAQLPLLVEVCLGSGVISPLDFLPLVSGPTRLVNLCQITLNFKIGKVGNRTSYQAFSTSARSNDMEGWELSADLAWAEDDDEAYVSKLKELIVTAEKNEIKFEGTVHQAIANFEDYRIEEVNRAVLDFNYFGGAEEREHLMVVREEAKRTGLIIPNLDLQALDPTRLELVKIDLPERNWYMYSLKNGGRF